MNDYSAVSGERRLDSADLSWFKTKIEKQLQHPPPALSEEQKEARTKSSGRIKKLIDDYPHEVRAAIRFLGLKDPRFLPESEDVLKSLAKLGEFADGVFQLPTTPLSFRGQTRLDVYELQAPNLRNQWDNFYFVAFVGFHKATSKILGVKPRTGLAGPRWLEENKDVHYTKSIDNAYQRRERLLEKLGVSAFVADTPENMDLIMDRLLKDDDFSGVKELLELGVRRIFQKRDGIYREGEFERYIRYFLTEVLFFASQEKELTLSFHFGTDIESVWDLAYSSILTHNRDTFSLLCEMAGIQPKTDSQFSGLNYQRPSFYQSGPGLCKIKPYDPDPKLSDYIPNLGDDEATIESKLGKTSDDNRRLLAGGLFYASYDVPDLREALRKSKLYRKMEEDYNDGVYPHRSVPRDCLDILGMLTTTTSRYFEDVL